MAKGAIWMVFYKLTDRSVGVISTMILARLLVPADFGLIAMAMSIIAMLELLGNFSFDIALIQNSQAERRHFDTAWTFNVLFSLGCALVLLALAIPSARFYHEPRLSNVMWLLALGSLVQGFENIGVVAFRKEMKFNKEFKFLLAKRLATFIVTITMAFALRNYWALVAGMLVGKFAGVVLSYLSQAYRPRFSLAARHELFHVSKWLFLNNILFFLRQRSGDFIIGRIAGSSGLGGYNVAYEISNLPTTELAAPINRAIFPGYSKMAGDLSVLRQGFLNVISMIAVFALPAGVGIALTAEPLVKVLLGARWSVVIPLIQVLAIYGILSALVANTSYIYLALGRPRVLTYLIMANVCVLVPATVWQTRVSGVLGAAWAELFTFIGIVPIVFFILLRKLQLRPLIFYHSIRRPLISVLVMSAAVRWLQTAWVLNPVWELVVSVAVGVGSFVVTLLGLWMIDSRPEGSETQLMNALARTPFAQMVAKRTLDLIQ
jgi:O-antigen/teichoic acid export membrane protein